MDLSSDNFRICSSDEGSKMTQRMGNVNKYLWLLIFRTRRHASFMERFWVGQNPCKFSNGNFLIIERPFPQEERPSTSIGIGHLFGEERRNM